VASLAAPVSLSEQFDEAAGGFMRSFWVFTSVFVAALAVAALANAQAQRVMGIDISYWNCGTSTTGISQANWNTAFNTPDVNGYTRQFAFIRASRGGTTGVDQPAGTPGGGTTSTLSRRYDDPRFMQNITRATAAGMLAGPYHFARPEIAGNTGLDEANHFIEAAGAWMRPGYLMPVFDLEAGSANGGNSLAQFSVDFSNRIYEAMGIRPAMYINGNYSNILQGATASLRDQLAKPVGAQPTVTGPAFPMLWNARYANESSPNSIPVQTGSPKTTPSTLSSYYGPWDDYGDAQPWSFWQYASTISVPGINAVDSTIDGNVSQGDIEYVRNYLVPAVWQHDASGDWSSLANWNSGQTVVAPVQAPGQTIPYSGGVLPTPRLPGAAGTGPTSGQYDTVILERPNANITVTVSSGSHNVRKLYMRESLEITGGTLSINYDPTYRANNNANVLHGGPISAQFSGAVTLGGSGRLNVHTLQVDAARTFTVNGGDLSFNRINLNPGATPATILVTGDMNVTPLGGAAAVIANGSGAGASGRIDLGGGNRRFHVADGAAATDLTIAVPLSNGGLAKSGAGVLALTAANTYAGDTFVEQGTLSISSPFLANAADVHLSLNSELSLNFAGTDVIDSLFINGVSQGVGTWGAIGSAADFTTPLITGTGLLQVSTFVPPPSPADFNLDGFVDAADLLVWEQNFGKVGDAAPLDGDANGDFNVDGNDFLVWQREFTGAPAAATAPIPEPGGLPLMAIAIAGTHAVRRRSH
jgi:autotransporter-associated beta strand protein